MTRSAARLPVALLTALLLTGALADCGRVRDSSLNPFNWFGRSEPQEATTTATKAEVDDGRALVSSVTALEVTKTNYGAIVRAEGLPPTQGWWLAELKAENNGEPDEKGVVTYRFLVRHPPEQNPASTPQSRQLSVAAFITSARLATISRIVVIGETNSRSSGR